MPIFSERVLREDSYSPTEKIRFDTAVDKKAALLKLWVLKEAAGKLTGEGINGYPCHTNFSLDDKRVFTQDGCILALLEDNPHAF